MNILYSELKYTQIILDNKGKNEVYGYLDDVLINENTGKIENYVINHRTKPFLLNFNDIVSLSESSLVFKNNLHLKPKSKHSDPNSNKVLLSRLKNRPVVTIKGHYIGKVYDFEIDTKNNSLFSLVISKNWFHYVFNKVLYVNVSQIITIEKNKIIISDFIKKEEAKILNKKEDYAASGVIY